MKGNQTNGAASNDTDFHGPTAGRDLVANWQTLQQVFIRPENEAVRATLVKYMQQILFGRHDFLRAHVGITEAESLNKLSERFQDMPILQAILEEQAAIYADWQAQTSDPTS